MATATPIYSFRGLVCYCHGGEHESWEYGGLQADVVAGEFYVLIQRQQGHTSSNRATSTPNRPHLPVVPLPVGAVFFQSTLREGKCSEGGGTRQRLDLDVVTGR